MIDIFGEVGVGMRVLWGFLGEWGWRVRGMIRLRLIV